MSLNDIEALAQIMLAIAIFAGIYAVAGFFLAIPFMLPPLSWVIKNHSRKMRLIYVSLFVFWVAHFGLGFLWASFWYFSIMDVASGMHAFPSAEFQAHKLEVITEMCLRLTLPYSGLSWMKDPSLWKTFVNYEEYVFSSPSNYYDSSTDFLFLIPFSLVSAYVANRQVNSSSATKAMGEMV